jgi:hypothetical protein
VATGKVARRADASEVSALLDSPEIALLIERLDGLRWTGRKGYGARALVGACLVKALYGLPTWTRAASLIADHHGLQDALGSSPSLWACYRFTTKLRAHSDALADCLDRVSAGLQAALPEYGIDVAIDASDMPAYANGHRTIYESGPERERYSDPDATWGHRSAVSTRGSGAFYGHKIHAAVCSRTGLPIAWQIQTAKRQESLYVASLLDVARARGIRPETVACDKGYDNKRVYAEIEERGANPVIPLKGHRLYEPSLSMLRGGRLYPRIARDSDRFKTLYRGRSAVEREFGRLKHDYGLAPLRVRGLERIQLHVDLVMLARLAQSLSRARGVAIAA